MAVTLEVWRKCWDDTDGWRYEVGPDSDGLECVEVRFVNEEGKIGSDRLAVAPEMARAIAKAMIDCADELDPRPTTEGGETT